MTERKVWAAFLMLALAWGTSFMFIKIAVRTLQPVTVVAFRLLVGWLGLLIIVRAQGLSLPRSPRTWVHLTIIGVVNVAIPFILIVWAESGQTGLDSGVAAILNSTVPLFSILIAGLVLQMERITGGRVLGLVVGFFGVVLLLGRDSLTDLGNVLPYVAVVAAALCYAIGSVYARRHLQGIKPVLLAAGQLFVADVFAFIFAFALEDFGAQTFSWEAIAALLWLGLFGSCLAYILYFFVLQAWDATRTTLVTYLVPVVGVTAGVVFLEETLDWRVIVGGLLILSGVATVNWRPRRRNRVQLPG